MTDDVQAALALDPSRVRAVLAAGDRPYISLKAAITLDGKIASRHGESHWITGDEARAAGRALRAQHGGIVVGIHTVLADDPQLTVRGADGVPNPARIVLDSRGRIPLQARCLADDGTRRIVVVGGPATGERVSALERLGVHVLRCPTARPLPGHFLPRLRALGIDTLLVEGGGTVHADLIAHHAANAVFLFLAGRVMGDAAAPGWCATLPGGNRLADAPALTLAPPLTIGTDVLIRGHFSAP
jgi:diaminohydroxyphosphoribosylaminopyrimidine deaminase/5-amino-6-(5-phosphoribosylamino)uracil reductase